MSTTARELCPTEDTEQICLFRWAALQSSKYPELALMYHIPNGGKRSKSEAARFRTMGVKAGVPDIFLPVKRSGHWLTGPSDMIAPYNGLYIELKRPAQSWLCGRSLQRLGSCGCCYHGLSGGTIPACISGMRAIITGLLYMP